MDPPPGIREILQALVADLHDDTCHNTQELLHCDHVGTETLIRAANALVIHAPAGVRTALLELMRHAHKEMAYSRSQDSRGWRRMYTDACSLLAFADLLDFWSCGDRTCALSAISFLDHAIVIAGAPGDGRLDFILGLIERIQSKYLDHPLPKHSLHESVAVKPPSAQSAYEPMPSAAESVPRIEAPPSLSSFISRLWQRPFVLPGFLLNWPALNEHPWCSFDYLRNATGPGRVVPVEVGCDYRSDDWTQKMMSWDEFLCILSDQQQSAGSPPQPVLYLAQHSLFSQFPALKDDIVVPDYVYSDLDPPDNYPQYAPPANEDRLVLNAWMGPAGAVSPAHTDPFFNFYGQVVGRKTVWLAPPDASQHMYPYPPHSTTLHPDGSGQSRNPAANNESPSMSNTSRVDVFAPEKSNFPDFWRNVVPSAMSVTLEPGDLLFFPPGWWHAMRSEETSFSVSMWF